MLERKTGSTNFTESEDKRKQQMPYTLKARNLLIVLGDQLSRGSQLFENFDIRRDSVWMAEVSGESKYVESSKQRTALFIAAMRHFAAELRKEGADLIYQKLDDRAAAESLSTALSSTLQNYRFDSIRVTRPGEHRVEQLLKDTCEKHSMKLQIIEDNHFFDTPASFAQYAHSKNKIRMEYYYREMRRNHRILMDGDQPSGGKWNFDASNRKPFDKQGPNLLRTRYRPQPDHITKDVLKIVEKRFPDHPGNLSSFAWPTCREEALRALEDFIKHDLPHFGTHQDAMWTDEPFLHHALLSSSLNLKLLNPREVVAAAESAYRNGDVPIESAEAFIRQILGWREYVRGIYWLHMPGYEDRNALSATLPLPSIYWDGDTEMNCIREVVTQTLNHGYAHHIQRLMVTGLYSLLLGVDPKEVHRWYLAVYVDAVEWVELPNTLGMSQYADGGLMASKPYVATGKYINRMSNYCYGCRYKPDKRTGDDACPFTSLYWDFLDRHRTNLEGNPRISLQLRNLDRIDPQEMKEIKTIANRIRKLDTNRSTTQSQPAQSKR